MSLVSALSIAAGGLANVTSQLAVVSQNVSNANTAGYTRELGQQTALSADGMALGVRTGPAARSIDTMLQDEAWQQDGTVAAMNVRAQALAAIDTAHGTPGQGNDLASLTGALSDAFAALSANPSATTQQSAVVSAASDLAGGINRVAAAIGTQRQSAQDSASQQITQLNTALASIGTLNLQISNLANQGGGTASLEDQRDAAMSTVAQLTGASFLRQASGDVQVILPSGMTLPTSGGAPLQLTDAELSPQTAPPAVTLNGQDITAELTGGQIGANLALRDTELPTFQAELDEFAHDTAARFSAAGLELFTDGGTAVAPAAATPPVQAGYLGLANRLQVNPAVAANPTLVQSGTGGAVVGASDQTIINAVLNGAFGTSAAAGTPAPQMQGLRPVRHAVRPVRGARDAGRLRRRRGRDANRRQQPGRHRSVGRAGRAADPHHQRRRRLGRVGRYGDVHHDRAAERLRRQRAHHHRSPEHVDLAARHRHHGMSTAPLSGLVQNGLLAKLVADSTATQAQLDKLTQQSASGQVAQTYGGLGEVAPVSINLRPQMAQITTWQQNITTANTTLSTTQSVLGQLENIATSFGSQALGSALQSATGATTLAAQAQQALQQVANLLNTKSNGQYVFAGSDSANPPIDTTALATYAATAAAQADNARHRQRRRRHAGAAAGDAGRHRALRLSRLLRHRHHAGGAAGADRAEPERAGGDGRRGEHLCHPDRHRHHRVVCARPGGGAGGAGRARQHHGQRGHADHLWCRGVAAAAGRGQRDFHRAGRLRPGAVRG